ADISSPGTPRPRYKSRSRLAALISAMSISDNVPLSRVWSNTTGMERLFNNKEQSRNWRASVLDRRTQRSSAAHERNRIGARSAPAANFELFVRTMKNGSVALQLVSLSTT